MLKLHGFSVSNYANMVKQCLIEKGIEFEQIHVRPSQDEAFLALSPMGKIPALETDEGNLVETPVILQYLEATYPEPSLSPTGAFAQAKAGEIIEICQLYIELAARRHLASAMFGQEQSQAALDEVRPQVEKGLRALGQLAEFGPFAMGDTFGNADIFMYHTFNLASQILQKTYQWDIISEVPGLTEHIAAMNERASTQRVMADNEKAMAELMAMINAG